MNILITGAASGIGYSAGVMLADKGYHVFLTTEDEKQLEVLREKIDDNKNIGTFKLDVNNKKDLNKLEKMDIDVLISNAAVGYGGSIIDTNIDKLRECYEVNVFSNFEIVKRVVNKMLDKGSGKIIIMSSMIANIPLPFFGIYASSKASISMIGQCLKKEVKLLNDKVKIVLIEPGIYKTGFNRYMIENKYDNNFSKFSKLDNSIRNLENEILNFAGVSNLDSISKKIVKVVESNNPNTIYRAPLIQNIMIKLYIKFFKK